ncbi:MAG: 3-dehydroquinate synthase [Firmicutes bacterium]|nr:3-dehydroquinate synthase [Bacillota bacterium]
MEKVRVKTRYSYDVLIGNDLTEETVSRISGNCKKTVLLWDEAVFSGYVAEIGNALEADGKEVMAISLEGGENAKTIESYSKIMKIMSDFNITRSDAVFGIGGGTVMDLAGFIASTYKRGVALVQLPTTLLAACDASVGGKNALNIGDEKNVVGTFYQPDLVVIDTRFLSALSDEVFSEGCAEIIKMGFLGDKDMIAELEKKSLLKNRGDEDYLVRIIKRCIEIKAAIVETDERDHGPRNILNLGHTLGHAIEAESNYKIHHGQAVAMGMVQMTRIAENKGIADIGTLGRLITLLAEHGLEWRCPYNINVLAGHVERDKKVRGGSLPIIVPEKFGSCVLMKLKIDDIKKWLTE